MALQYKLKAGGITNLTDARYFNALEADWLGFNLDVLAENSIGLQEAQAIKSWLFAPNIVLECGHHQDKEEMVFLGNELEVAAVQVNWQHTILMEETFLFPLMVVADFVDLENDLFKKTIDQNELTIETIILVWSENLDRNGFVWSDFKAGIPDFKKAIARLKRQFTVLIELPFEPDWMLEALELLAPDGIHISTKREDAPGMSYVDEYDELLALIELED
jgi:hypothetical protein